MKTRLYFQLMKFCISFLFLFFYVCGIAQVKIVRDPIACAYGLQNNQNQWIVPAKYQQLLFLENDFFACQSGEKWGIIRSNGKKMTEIRYDHVSVFSIGRFLLSERISTNQFTIQQSGLMDTAGHWLIPQQYSSISRMENNHFLLVKASYANNTGLTYQSSIADAKGTLLFPFLEGVLLNRFYLSEANLLGNTIIGSHTVSGNVRLVNQRGEIISDSVFDMGMPCGEHFIVTRNRKYGLLNAEGKTLVEPKYLFEKENYDYTNPLFCLHGHHQFIFVENGKRGVLNGEWKETVPAIYNRIMPLDANAFPFTKGRFIAYHDEENTYRLLSEDGKVLAEADTLLMRMIPIKRKDLYDIQRYQIAFVYGEKQNGNLKYGLLDHEGNTLLAAHFDQLFFNAESELILLSANPGNNIPLVYTLKLNVNQAPDKKPLTFLQKLNNLYWFGHDDKITSLRYSNTCNCWEQSLYGANSEKQYGRYTLMNGGSEGIIFDHTQNNIETVKFIDWHSGNFAIIQNKEGMNLLHPQKGRLFKQNMLQINQQFFSVNRIWCQHENGRWLIYDTLGNVRTSEAFDAISYDWDTLIVQQNFKKGLLDKNCRWILKPMFTELFRFTSKYYVGVTPGRHVAIINPAEPNAFDSTYTSFRPIFEDVNSQILIYCLEKNGKTQLFDQRGNILNTTEKELITQYWTEPNRFGNDFFVECKTEEKIYLNQAKELVYALILPYYRLNLAQNKSVVNDGIRSSESLNPYRFKLEYASYNRLSFSVRQQSGSYIDIDTYKIRDMGARDYASFGEVGNYIWQNKQWKQVAFSDLFNPKNEAYQTQIIEAIQNRPDLRIDCNEPRALFAGASQFSFEKDGIRLYFFENQAQAFQIILTPKQLERIPTAKWILEWM